jgi:hypothetical protein
VQFRDTEVQLRTLVAAKCALMSSVSGNVAFNNINKIVLVFFLLQLFRRIEAFNG